MEQLEKEFPSVNPFLRYEQAAPDKAEWAKSVTDSVKTLIDNESRMYQEKGWEFKGYLETYTHRGEVRMATKDGEHEIAGYLRLWLDPENADQIYINREEHTRSGRSGPHPHTIRNQIWLLRSDGMIADRADLEERGVGIGSWPDDMPRGKTNSEIVANNPSHEVSSGEQATIEGILAQFPELERARAA